MKVSSLFLVLVWRAVIRCRAFQPLMRLESISSPAAAASWRTIVPAERERKTARSPFGVITKFAAVMRRSSGDDEWYSPPQASTVSTSTVTLHSKALQTDVTTLEELHRHLNDPNDQRLVIVKFYASWYVRYLVVRSDAKLSG